MMREPLSRSTRVRCAALVSVSCDVSCRNDALQIFSANFCWHPRPIAIDRLALIRLYFEYLPLATDPNIPYYSFFDDLLYIKD
jgi:hypothetical protein